MDLLINHEVKYFLNNLSSEGSWFHNRDVVINKFEEFSETKLFLTDMKHLDDPSIYMYPPNEYRKAINKKAHKWVFSISTK